MNLPNKLSIVRILLIPIILLCMLPVIKVSSEGTFFAYTMAGKISALVFFCLASITDLLDGKIARSRGLVTNLGKFLDPIADKLLVLSVFIAFIELGRISTLIVVVILGRELAVTGIRLLGAEKGKVIAASWYGKIKTVTQMATLIWLLFEPILLQLICANNQCADHGNFIYIYVIGNVLTILAVIATMLSGYDYFVKNRQFLGG